MEYVIQIYTLNNIRSMFNEQDACYFALSLFHVVLQDQVFYTYYPTEYRRYRHLTYSPKLLGNCHNACHNHQHPSYIIDNVISRHEQTQYRSVINESISYANNETTKFLDKFFPNMDRTQFWGRYSNELSGLDHYDCFDDHRDRYDRRTEF